MYTSRLKASGSNSLNNSMTICLCFCIYHYSMFRGRVPIFPFSLLLFFRFEAKWSKTETISLRFEKTTKTIFCFFSHKCFCFVSLHLLASIFTLHFTSFFQLNFSFSFGIKCMLVLIVYSEQRICSCSVGNSCVVPAV